ncbi:Protein-glutamine gamma-glutamyltransferase [BD1-7 clade bacterium]|uniref:Protein-glutamine gamma-glutamyltransferase n=1 Tax=BD1-7 clade bacterium TaxID=2029982 RepID=A0A5S9NLZ9_9GAMM|nr:Protein-glutamine gamma-glutamyltransferase [BD1-7 clade bacterium]CAA0093887.1 Protein-glutamine gamma-glutamyltransferase [BD1-7 clade bacterium]
MADQKFQVPRRTFVWLLIAQTFLLLPHLIRYPTLVVPVWLIASGWRIMIYRARWSHPSTWVKATLIVFGVAAVAAQGFGYFSLDTSVAVLLVAFLLKFIEMRTRRDVLVVIYLGYFVIVTWLLMDQSMLAGAYLIISLLLVTTCLVTLHVDKDTGDWHFPLVFSAKALAVSVPIMVVGFMVFPRLDPFWSVPIQGKNGGVTGISDSMSPGNISQLAQSDRLAFRVEFDGEAPAMRERYWRAIVLSRFDGKTWHPLDEIGLPQPPLDDIVKPDAALPQGYRIVMEPHQEKWLFTLPGTISIDTKVHFQRDFTLRSLEPIFQKKSLRYEWLPGAQLGTEIYRYHHRENLFVPEGFNPRALALAEQIVQQSSSVEDYMSRVEGFFRQNTFTYTLSPGELGRNSIDEFLFDGQRGFCEHYASAYVVLMRAAGIPARVVTGYLGGEKNPYENYLSVRQMDAHAWTEVWVDGKGWVRVDPTGFVAPDRIEHGSQAALSGDESFLSGSPFSSRHYEGLSWLLAIEQRYEQLNYLWVTQVLSFHSDTQKNTLKKLLGDVSPQRIALFVMGVFISVTGLVFIVLYLRQLPPPLPPVEREYQRLLKRLSREGFDKEVGEGPMDFAARVTEAYPDRVDLKHVFECYRDLAYRPHISEEVFKKNLDVFSKAIRALKF